VTCADAQAMDAKTPAAPSRRVRSMADLQDSSGTRADVGRPETARTVQAKRGGACEGPARTARCPMQTRSAVKPEKFGFRAYFRQLANRGMIGSSAGAATVQAVQQASRAGCESGAPWSAAPWQIVSGGTPARRVAACAVARPATTLCSTNRPTVTATSG